MGQIDQTISAVKQRVYRVRKLCDAALSAPAQKPATPKDALEAIRQTVAEIHAETEELEAWYAEDERFATCLALATPPLSRV